MRPSDMKISPRMNMSLEIVRSVLGWELKCFHLTISAKRGIILGQKCIILGRNVLDDGQLIKLFQQRKSLQSKICHKNYAINTIFKEISELFCYLTF